MKRQERMDRIRAMAQLLLQETGDMTSDEAESAIHEAVRMVVNVNDVVRQARVEAQKKAARSDTVKAGRTK